MHLREGSRMPDQNVQFLRLGQFLSHNKGWKLHTWHTLTTGEDQQKPVNRI